MALNFPLNPTLNQEYTVGDVTWRWNGEAWVILPPTEVQYDTVNTTDLTVTNDTTLNNLSITGTITGLSTTLNDLSDVTVSSPNDQDILQYNQSSSQWVSAPAPSGGGGAVFNGGTISNPLFVDNSTASTSSQSGALRVTGGVGIQGDINVGGILTVEDNDLYIKTGKSLRLYNTNNDAYVAIQSPSSPDDTVYVLPANDGSAGQFLRTNGAGLLSWASAAGAGGGTPPGGSDLQVQFNNSNLFDGDAGLVFDPNQQMLTVSSVTITETTESTDETTGTLIVKGGVGIVGQINTTGSINKFSGGTDSSSINTGTIVVTGGVGISQNVNVGANVSVEIEPTDPNHLTNKKYVDANILAFAVAFGA